MTNTFTIDDIYQEPDNSRGTLLYREAYGCKLIAITINVAYSQQCRTCNLPVLEDEDPLQRTDPYQFSVTDGTRIQLTIDLPASIEKARGTVRCDHFIADEQPLPMSIVRSSEDIVLEPAICSQEALDEALDYYADRISGWLDETRL